MEQVRFDEEEKLRQIRGRDGDTRERGLVGLMIRTGLVHSKYQAELIVIIVSFLTILSSLMLMNIAIIMSNPLPPPRAPAGDASAFFLNQRAQ